MTTFDDLKKIFSDQDYKIIIAGDGEPKTHVKKGNEIVPTTAAGGVAVAFDSLSKAANATYIGRARTKEDKLVVDSDDKVKIDNDEDSYTLKRMFFSDEDLQDYYYGYSNQTLWPLCHIAFERPIFNQDWYDGFVQTSKAYAKAIEEEIDGKTFIWLNDYQLSLVPLFLNRPKDTILAYFWHIPWPTWEIFRILPHKKDILWSLLSCDYLAFHRRYQARNFLDAVDRELEARIDRETNTVFFDENILRVGSHPMGIDTDVIKDLVEPVPQDSFLVSVIKDALGLSEQKEKIISRKKDVLEEFFKKYKVMLGVDRLDYTKGIPYRLDGIDLFFKQNPKYIGRAIYVGIMSPTRKEIPSYKALKKEIMQKVNKINKKYSTKDWKPLHMVYEGYTRDDVINLYKKASLCLVTPVDDGMNLVSKEFVIASSFANNPGMLVLSQFAGSAIDLSSSLIVNPYDTQAVATAIKRGLEMKNEEKKERVKHMVSLLEEHNVYEWARSFVWDAITAARENHQAP